MRTFGLDEVNTSDCAEIRPIFDSAFTSRGTTNVKTASPSTVAVPVAPKSTCPETRNSPASIRNKLPEKLMSPTVAMRSVVFLKIFTPDTEDKDPPSSTTVLSPSPRFNSPPTVPLTVTVSSPPPSETSPVTAKLLPRIILSSPVLPDKSSSAREPPTTPIIGPESVPAPEMLLIPLPRYTPPIIVADSPKFILLFVPSSPSSTIAYASFPVADIFALAVTSTSLSVRVR